MQSLERDVETLRKIPLFADLPTARLKLIAYTAEVVRFEPGEVIVVGALNRLEIWAPSAWQPYRSRIEDAPEALAEQLQDLGI